MTSVRLANSFDMSDVSQADFQSAIASNIDFFKWTSSSGFQLIALSSADDITTNLGTPTGGTISGVMSLSGPVLVYSVTGFTASLTSLIDTVSPSASHEKYWETLLAGATTFDTADNGAYTLTGDFILVSAAQSLTGAADTFNLVVSSPLIAIGDAFNVGVGGTLTGGADTFLIGNGTFVSARVSGSEWV